MIKAPRILFLFTLFAFLFVYQTSSNATVVNKLANPGFEEELGGTGNWNFTGDRGLATPNVGGGTAPQGVQVLRISESGLVAGQFGFTFQGPFDAKPGDQVTFTGFAREVLDDGDAQNEIPQLVIEFQGDTIATTQVAVGTASATFTRLTNTAVAPAGTQRVVFVVRLQNADSTVGLNTSVGEFDDLEGTINGLPIFLSASPSAEKMSSGEAGVLTVRFENTSATAVGPLELVVEPPKGIRVLPNEGRLDERRLTSREGSVVYNVGTLNRGQNSIFSVPFLLSSGIVPGKSYEIILFAQNLAGGQISSPIRVLIRAELDPVFDEGTIIGKVFHDQNRNGIQDSGEHGYEYGIGGVRIVTEEGITVITDPDGKYYIPGVKPGRHVVKVDGHTLPQDTEFLTEEAYLTKITPGLLAKVNFAVFLPDSKLPAEFANDLQVTVTQGVDFSKPVLDIVATPDVLRVGIDRLEKDVTFHLNTNYQDFIKDWLIEIRDDLGQAVWVGFGVGQPPSEVTWTGVMESGLMIRPGYYSYQLKVHDSKGREDWSLKKFLRVLSKTDPKENETALVELAPVGDFNLFKDGKRSIPLVAKPTLHIQGKTKKSNTITINGYPAEVDQETGFFEAEIYVTPGEKEITVTATSPEGEGISFVENVTVKDSTFFMVALAEEQFGMNFQDGNVQTVAEDDLFKDGFYEDGRLAFYLRGKLKGKFLAKVHYDTDEKRSSLFTNLDDDDYYPVYGDSSVRDYESQDTLSRLFVVVEMERSFVKWGSFKTNFNDVELATYNRTLNGFRAHYETPSTTPYGDPKQGLDIYVSEARHRGDHNEFAATGGTLYYLRNRNLIQGGEKVRVEIRDKIQNIPIHSYDLFEGKDYNIDYTEGRILLNKPLSSVAASDTIISSDILDGSPVFLIVDYEYDAGANAFVNQNRGARGHLHLGEHVKLGLTYVEETRRTVDYDMRGIDMTIKLGRNTKIYAEYATSVHEQVDQATSFNGGLSFANQEPINGVHSRPRENAYLVKAESKPVKNLEISGFLQAVEPGFSSDSIKSQEGFKKYGVSAKYNLGRHAALRYRFDHSSVVDQLFPLEDNGVITPFDTFQSHTIQAAYDNGKIFGNLEYRNQSVDIPKTNLLSTILSEEPFRNGYAAKVGYRWDEKITPYLRAQIATNEGDGNQFGAGLRYNINNDIAAYVEQMFGVVGDSTLFGFERNDGPSSRSYANLRMVDRGIGAKALSTTIGNSFSLSEKSKFFTEREYSNYNGIEGSSDIMGYEAKITKNLSFGARYERRHLDNGSFGILDVQAENNLNRANTHNTLSTSISYDNHENLKLRTYWEGRRDTDVPHLWQVVTRNSAEYKMNQDLTFLGKLDFGKSRFTEVENTPADFFEFNSGFAYRPINYDVLNMLGRYSFVRNKGSDFQFSSPLFGGVEVDESSHIFAIDIAYDLHRYVSMVEKFAYKNSTIHTSVGAEAILHNVLWVNRLNFHVTRKWDIAMEYRMLWQFDALITTKHGALFEIDREIYDYARIGLGYNFTDFNDDLTKSDDIDSHGPFVRLTGKF